MPIYDVIIHLDSIPDGLVVDDVSRLLFYTDTGLKVVGVVTLVGHFHKVLVADGLDHPRAIVVDSARGDLFWTDWGLHSRIERARMDGSKRRKLVDTGVGAWPNGLAIDVRGEFVQGAPLVSYRVRQ